MSRFVLEVRIEPSPVALSGKTKDVHRANERHVYSVGDRGFSRLREWESLSASIHPPVSSDNWLEGQRKYGDSLEDVC